MTQNNQPSITDRFRAYLDQASSIEVGLADVCRVTKADEEIIDLMSGHDVIPAELGRTTKELLAPTLGDSTVGAANMEYFLTGGSAKIIELFG